MSTAVDRPLSRSQSSLAHGSDEGNIIRDTSSQSCSYSITSSDQNLDPNFLGQSNVVREHNAISKFSGQQGNQESKAAPPFNDKTNPTLDPRTKESRRSFENYRSTQLHSEITDASSSIGNRKSSSATSRTSISSKFNKNWNRMETMNTDTVFERSFPVQKGILLDSDHESMSSVDSRQLKRTVPTSTSRSFASSTVSSRKRSEKITKPVTKKEQWTPCATKPRSPRISCTGKAAMVSSAEIKEKTAKKSVKTSPGLAKPANRGAKPWDLSMPKTPTVLSRKANRPGKPSTPPEKSRAFIPNPTPYYLRTEHRPEVRQTRKSMQLTDMHSQTGDVSRLEMPKELFPHVTLEPTVVKPFALASVVKHEERMLQIRERLAAEEGEDQKRREFHPVSLRPEILRGPTFVPRRSEGLLTRPVDLLPHAHERSERTLAFEAQQRARMDELERSRKMAAEEREKLEMEQLRIKYGAKQFKSRPVPLSHYTPDISPVRVETKAHSSDSTIYRTVFPSQRDTKFYEDVANQAEPEDSQILHTNIPGPANDLGSPNPSASKAVTILQGIRDSLSPLLGRSSTSDS